MNKTTVTSAIFTPPQLGLQQAHAWYVHLESLAAESETWQQLLSQEERDRAARFRFARDQRRFSVTRALLRLLLGAYLECEPESLIFHTLEHGKPMLDGRYRGTPLNFNVSHSDGMALFGVTLDRPIGVDVERVRHDFEVVTIAKRFFSPAEQRDFLSLPPAQQHRAFFDCWTRKEAYVKALGDGLSHPLHQFDVCLAPGEPARLTATRPDAQEVSRWTMAAPDVGAGYAAAVAAKAKNLEITCQKLPKLV
jgi:4'-phosphopantetheinyl transferase